MCGRFTVWEKKEVYVKQYAGYDFPEEWSPRFNIAPSQRVPAVLSDAPRKVVPVLWGMKPHWSPGLLINARAERLGRKSFSPCIVLADGFYEWQKDGARKRPFYFFLKSGEPFAFAGLWDESPGGRACAIITTEPNEIVASVHNRMPVILRADGAGHWLRDGDLELLKPLPSGDMNCHEVAPLVNKASVDGEELIRPGGGSTELPLWAPR